MFQIMACHNHGECVFVGEFAELADGLDALIEEGYSHNCYEYYDRDKVWNEIDGYKKIGKAKKYKPDLPCFVRCLATYNPMWGDVQAPEEEDPRVGECDCAIAVLIDGNHDRPASDKLAHMAMDRYGPDMPGKYSVSQVTGEGAERDYQKAITRG